MFALVDCDSFYVSCERLFDPSLEGRPVLVLSGPNGCVVSRSVEAKRLGARVGDPWFKVRDLPGMRQAAAFTANFEVYGDISRRVMQALARFGHPMATYSIDEAFVWLPQSMDARRRADWAHEAARACLSCGAPVSIGVGSTKTRAKLASSFAKPACGGVGFFDWADREAINPEALAARLAQTPTEEVWGVGPAAAAKLEALGARSVSSLMEIDFATLKRHGTVTLERVGRELRGEPVHALGAEDAPPLSIERTRTFERPVASAQELGGWLASFAEAGTFQLRAKGLLATRAEIYFGTHLLDRRHTPHHVRVTLDLDGPTSDALLLSALCARGLASAYETGYAYRRAGLRLWGLTPNPAGRAVPVPHFEPLEVWHPGSMLPDQHASPCQSSTLLDHKASESLPKPVRGARSALMAVMDEINGRYGKGSLRVASAHGAKPGRQRPGTRLSEVLVVRAQ